MRRGRIIACGYCVCVRAVIDNVLSGTGFCKCIHAFDSSFYRSTFSRPSCHLPEEKLEVRMVGVVGRRGVGSVTTGRNRNEMAHCSHLVDVLTLRL